uniref:Uncharacterized protein n=1 Tax=Anguilla anguilla TaxID=7936 RepID=A0A0E9P6V4_ANGAN
MMLDFFLSPVPFSFSFQLKAVNRMMLQ